MCSYLSLMLWCVFLFVFKQKTAYEMRISDWSSDVCSSDLGQPGPRAGEEGDAAGVGKLQRRLRIVVDEDFLDRRAHGRMVGDHRGEHGVEMREPVGQGGLGVGLDQIGRAHV